MQRRAIHKTSGDEDVYRPDLQWGRGVLEINEVLSLPVPGLGVSLPERLTPSGAARQTVFGTNSLKI